MAFQMTTAGPGWRLAGSLIQLGHEVAAAHPDFTCLGTIGDAAHQAEGTASDHNPFIKDPSGVGVVRAIDIGGPDTELKALRQELWQAYEETDNRIFEFGYAKGCSDNLINNWGFPFGVHVDAGDAGHLHVSVTQADGNHPSAAGYVAAIDSTRPWFSQGLTLASSSSQIVPPITAPGDDEMKFKMIRRTSTGAVYAYNNGGMFWHVPDAGWVRELSSDPDCLGGPTDVDESRFDALASLADSCVTGPNGQLNFILTAVNKLVGGK